MPPRRAAYVRQHVTPPFKSRLMPSTVSEQYRALVAQGEIERDAAQEAIAARLARLEERLAQHRLSRKSSASRLAVREKESRRADQGTLHPRRRRARQDHADGLVLCRKRREAETPRAFSRVHGRRARARSRVSPEDQIGRDHRRRSDRPDRRRARRGSLAPLLRRIPRHRHRRRDDSSGGCSRGCSRPALWSWPRRMSSRTNSTRTA